MKSDWTEILSVDFLNSINCRVKLLELQKVIPYHSEKYKKIILNASSPFTAVTVHVLTLATSLIVTAAKSFTPYEIPIFDGTDGRINW